jgi:gamma-glutamylcyclotransferase (GGCT)/AIG2-like uncharacterized protein YtfP
MEKIFTYGTLQDPSIQQHVIDRLLGDGTPDTLRGYKIAKLNGIHATYNIILPATQQSVDGRVYEVTADELAQIDTYEGDAYMRVSVTLQSNTRAWVYRDNPRSALHNQIVDADA